MKYDIIFIFKEIEAPTANSAIEHIKRELSMFSGEFKFKYQAVNIVKSGSDYEIIIKSIYLDNGLFKKM